jgi:hypothetical protein
MLSLQAYLDERMAEALRHADASLALADEIRRGLAAVGSQSELLWRPGFGVRA